MNILFLQIFTPREYINVYYIVLFAIVVFFLIGDRSIVSGKKRFLLIGLISTLFMGLRPLSGVFTDMPTYASFYSDFNIENVENSITDAGFIFYMNMMSQVVSVDIWFFITSVIYVLGYVFLYHTLSPDKGGYIMFFLFISFFFFAYGTNTIRAGMANSILMIAYALFLRNKILLSIFISLLSISIHSSMLLLVLCGIIGIFYKNIKFYYFVWFLSLLISFIWGSFVSSYLSSIIDFDDRFSDYLLNTENFGGVFRWDFILYGALPVLWSMFLWLKKYADINYWWFVRIYLLANSFWVLVIRTAFSDRFAYMSWSLIPILLMYPLLESNQIIANKLLIYKIFVVIISGLTFYLYIF